MNIDFPLRIGGNGRTRSTDDADHLRDMITLLLFTHPGERVMRPDFGTGLLQTVFAPNSAELAATVQLTVQAALTQWLGDLIEPRAVTVRNEEATLYVTIVYTVRSSGEVRTETFNRSAA